VNLLSVLDLRSLVLEVRELMFELGVKLFGEKACSDFNFFYLADVDSIISCYMIVTTTQLNHDDKI